MPNSKQDSLPNGMDELAVLRAVSVGIASGVGARFIA